MQATTSAFEQLLLLIIGHLGAMMIMPPRDKLTEKIVKLGFALVLYIFLVYCVDLELTEAAIKL